MEITITFIVTVYGCFFHGKEMFCKAVELLAFTFGHVIGKSLGTVSDLFTVPNCKEYRFSAYNILND